MGAVHAILDSPAHGLVNLIALDNGRSQDGWLSLIFTLYLPSVESVSSLVFVGIMSHFSFFTSILCLLIYVDGQRRYVDAHSYI